MDLGVTPSVASRTELGVLVPKLVAGLCAAGMAAYAGMHPVSVAGVVVLAACFAAREYFGNSRWLLACGVFGGALSLLVPHRMLFGADNNFAANYPIIVCAAWAWGMAVSVLLLAPTKGGARHGVAAVLAAICALTSASLWGGTAYAEALRAPFYLAIPATVGLLILLKRVFVLPVSAVQVANTCILLLVGIPAVDLAWKPPKPARLPSVAKKFYSYELAKKDPVMFERWWQFFLAEFNATLRQILQKDRRRLAPARTIPGAEAKLFESSVRINTLGFRGREINLEKGGAYRIVALGESTTFGLTLESGDRPWPELLENLIRERAGLARSVEVVNAGIPGFTLHDNLRRFIADIAPLKPDMILSYHGYNGFAFLDKAVPAPVGQVPPTFRPRALQLLAQAEYRAKLLHFRRTQLPVGDPARKRVPVGQTELARLYDGLYEVTKTNNARLVVATHSLAVNARSDPRVVEFYRLGFPAVAWSIKANRAHTELVNDFAQSHPEVVYVDTQPGLDGHHEKFIDLVHLTQEGRNQIAEAFYAAIKPVLVEELAQREAVPLSAR